MPPAFGQVRGEGHDGFKERITLPPDCMHPGGWRGGGLPSTASKLGLGCRNPRVHHIWALGEGGRV